MATQTLNSQNIIDSIIEIVGLKSETKYSLGFSRYLKLSRKVKSDAFTNLFMQGFTEILANNKELESRLSKMSEKEYQAFKRGSNVKN